MSNKHKKIRKTDWLMSEKNKWTSPYDKPSAQTNGLSVKGRVGLSNEQNFTKIDRNIEF